MGKSFGPKNSMRLCSGNGNAAQAGARRGRQANAKNPKKTQINGMKLRQSDLLGIVFLRPACLIPDIADLRFSDRVGGAREFATFGQVRRRRPIMTGCSSRNRA
jgi:hypothetical protein